MDVNQTRIKMSGYLCKKNTKGMINTWKTYWFVLEDRLLLFYRSKNEYEAISPCKGSINLGPPCMVKSFPSIENSFQIETRTNVYTLKATNLEDQINWMQAIMAALQQNQNFVSNEKKLTHFRYTLKKLIPEKESNDVQETILEKQNLSQNEDKLKKNSVELIERLQKIGAHSYSGNLSSITKVDKKNLCSIETATATLEKSINPSDIEQPEDILRTNKPCGYNIYERISGESNSSHGSNRVSFIVDNENYSIPTRRSKTADNGGPSKSKNFVLNKTQSALIENDQYISGSSHKDEVVYAEPNLNGPTVIKDYDKERKLIYKVTSIEPSTCDENVYEDLDTYNIYSVPNVKTESQAGPTSTEKNFDKPEKEQPKQKLKKTKSFMKIDWKRKNKKNKDREQNDEKLYEEVLVAPVEKIELNNENTLQMLSELQNILELKKSKLKAAVSNSSNSGNDQTWNTEKSRESSLSQNTDSPKSPSNQQTTNDKSKTIEPNDVEQFRSFDEIFENLDKEKMVSKNSVQKLIQKFNDPGDVVMRVPKTTENAFFISRHSDDLNQILEELAKVTSAPIMTPGVTSSLFNPNLADEWKNLLPIRQKRLSEPDYDVPRSHRSISFPINAENFDTIPVTKFFEPVLALAVTNNSETEESLIRSLTPDSLEVEGPQNVNQTMVYQNSNYIGIDETQNVSLNFGNTEEQITYSLPKSYVSVATQIVNTCHNIYGNQLSDDYIIYKNVKNIDIQEIYNDSLEHPNEPK